MDSRRRRTVLTALLAVITSATTLTVVHKCVMIDTIKIHTTSPVREIARAAHGTIVASAQVVLPRRDTVVVHDTIVTTRVVRAAAGPPETHTPLVVHADAMLASPVPSQFL